MRIEAKVKLLCRWITKGKYRYHIANAGLVFIWAVFVHPAANAVEPLVAGDWKGTYLTYDGTRYNLGYKVSYLEDSETELVKIKLIYVDMEPQSEFTYLLSDIKASRKKLEFKIFEEYELKECSLEYDDDSYSGTCISSAGDADALSSITMVLVKPEVEEK